MFFKRKMSCFFCLNTTILIEIIKYFILILSIFHGKCKMPADGFVDNLIILQVYICIYRYKIYICKTLIYIKNIVI